MATSLPDHFTSIPKKHSWMQRVNSIENNMPTVLSDSDHQSLTSHASFHFQPPQPSLPQTTRQPQQQHYRQRFLAHFHPPYPSCQLQFLPAEPPQSIPVKRVSSSRGTKKKTSFSTKRASSFSQHRSHGPKWIHRHGLVNGINYHWVETINISDEDGVKATDKPLVILLHGIPQFWYAWRHQIVPLGEAGYRVVAPDLRGFNLTDKPAAHKRKTRNDKNSGIETEDYAGYDMETLTADVRALILHLGHSEANIVGHDWGGIIAWAFAARFPHHTTKLVVMNAPHLCHWRDVVMDCTSASCFQQAWWTCWYTLCCQLLPSWIPESILSYHRSWILTHSMGSSPTWAGSVSCAPNSIQDELVCATANPKKRPKGFPALTSRGGGCAGCWKQTDMDLYRDAISKPGAIYALLEYYRNLWLSVQQVEHYGKIHQDLPILVLWGLKDKTFPRETYAHGWDEWIDHSRSTDLQEKSSSPSQVTVAFLDCGHFTPEEAPTEVNQHLLDFFQQPLPMLCAEL